MIISNLFFRFILLLLINTFRGISTLSISHLLLEGLSQASVDYWMPLCNFYPNSIKDLLDEVDNIYPQSTYLRILAHPCKREEEEYSASADSIPFCNLKTPYSWSLSSAAAEGTKKNSKKIDMSPNASSGEERKIVIAVGPERGWTESELQEFAARGFIKVHMLGQRVLRTDIAIPALLALAYEWHSTHAA